ncbi:uncharacterized protein [Miscanthus floridulus]|uniref:uncharacterized protein isoform X2 n=1 Tax=Miscanthus floridulus TaxID=154761 RepID=UPI0034587972
MGKSSVKWIKSVLFGKKSSSRSGSTNAKDLSNLTGFCFIGYSALLAPASEVLIPPELLASKTMWTPDWKLGQYEDLVAWVTNFHNENKDFMVLEGDIFYVPIRKDIVQRVVRWQLAKRQQGTHSTKTISEVSGTGRKPYKQKELEEHGMEHCVARSSGCNHAWS